MLDLSARPSSDTDKRGGWFLSGRQALVPGLFQPPRPFDAPRKGSMANGIFVGLPESDLLAIRDQAVADIKAGRVITSYSDSGTSVSKTFAMQPKEILLEVQMALRQLDPATYGERKTIIRTDYTGFQGF
jgi:hypothetical protein